MSDQRQSIYREGHAGIELAIANLTAAMDWEYADVGQLHARPKSELVDGFITLLAVCQGISGTIGTGIFLAVAKDIGLRTQAALAEVDIP